MPDTHERNERLKATMRDRNTGNLNTSGKDGIVPCSPNQSSGLKRRPMAHVDPGTGQKS
jgi:hypothetical protein